MITKIEIDLNTKSISKAIKDLNNYKKRLNQRIDELTERLAEIGMNEAKVRFDNAKLNFNDEVKTDITVEPCENGYRIVASGSEICFVEFGAGVYYNGSEPYPIERPQGVVGIGEYGQGKGKRQGWYYKDEKGEKHFTHGTKAVMPMYNAARTVEEQILEIAKEVFAK